MTAWRDHGAGGDEGDPRPGGRPAGFGGDWRGSRPSFDDPMSWSLPVARIARISVRVHLFFVAFVLAPLASNASELIASYSYALKKTRKVRFHSLVFVVGAPP